MGRPTQPALSWRGLPTGEFFSREYQTQETLPLDGAGRGRTYSPFVVRVLPPTILGEQSESTLLTPDSEERVAATRTDFAAATREVGTVAASTAAYAALTQLGTTVPGLSDAPLSALRSAYSQARFAANQTEERARSTATRVVAAGGDLTALSLALQLKAIASVPPLILLINPMSMSIEYTKVAQIQERSRQGFIYQAWGEEMPKLSFSFRIGAYVVGSTARGQRAATGIQRASRRDSASFQQLMAMLTFFQSGGYLHDTEHGSRAYPMVGNLALEYDSKVYVGHMDSFSFSEEETQQNGGLQFEFDFTAIREYDFATRAHAPTPMDTPSGFRSAGRSRRTLVRDPSSRDRLQVFTAPTVGFDSELAPPQPWADARVTENGTVPAVIRSRRG